MAKLILPEDLEDEVVSVPVEAPDPRIVKDALITMINGNIQEEWNLINSLKSSIATINSESPEKSDIIALLNEVIDDTTINIGMLTKALSLIDDKQQELTDAGSEKAEEIISEPVTADLD